jgi:pilus assembly protein Flp/PilA
MLELIKSLLAYLRADEKGQDLTEYALLVALIAIIVVLAVLFFGENVSSFFSLLGSTVKSWLS